MDVHCPQDQHFRTMDRSTGQLSCPHQECRCAECHRRLSAQEQTEWRGHQ
jgi:hypothetical protein